MSQSHKLVVEARVVPRIRESRIRLRMARRKGISKMRSASAVVRRAIMLVIVRPSQRIGSASIVANWDITRTSVHSPLRKSKW